MKLAPLAMLSAFAALPAAAQDAPPRLLIAISVDQLSADLFAEYRRYFIGGMARLQEGAVFPSGYQSHAATETCPGHSTILTGARPARSGIIANDWTDLKTPREDKTVYCAEDESVPGSSSSNYTVSAKHLKVPTLGGRMKIANPASRVVSVAGKDRAAVMMGGATADESWWWDGKGYATYTGRAMPAVVAAANRAVADRIAAPQAALPVPPQCTSHDRAVGIGSGKTVGTVRFARAAGDARAFRASPEFDGATLALAAGLIQGMKLGQGSAPDIISIGASATDYVGHTYGSGGVEMCLQLMSLDRDLGDFFRAIDRLGIDYAVVLTADHGGLDLPERQREVAVPGAARIDPAFNAKAIGTALAQRMGLSGQLLWGGNFGDVWIDQKLTPVTRSRVLAEAIKVYAAHPQVETVVTAAQVAATTLSGPPDSWSPAQRVRASYDPARSGDFVVVLKPRVTPIADPTRGYVATHGSVWDYDRRVPMLFWRKGMTPFEQPLAVETVDIAPTLAALIGVRIPSVEIDGRCLDLAAGPADSCK